MLFQLYSFRCQLYQHAFILICYKAKPLQPNFETGSYIRSYVNLFSATGKQAQDEGNELTRDDFGKGYTFFGFDLTPDGCDGGCFHLTQKGNLRIEIHFATALEQTVNVVVYGEFDVFLLDFKRWMVNKLNV